MQLEIISHEPQGNSKPHPILFIHGAWHAAWCWENFLPYFAEQGYSAHALSLRGHGNSEGSVRWASLSQYVDDVEQVAATFDQHPILVGHSMGGMIVQKYLERNADRVPGAVMLAPLPFNGTLPMNLRLLIQQFPDVLTMLRHLSSHPLVNTPQKAQHLFFSPTVPLDQLETYTAKLQAESMRVAMLDAAFWDLPAPFKPPNPLLVLGAVHDNVFPIKEVQQTARVYGTKAEFINIAHDMMLDVGWEQVAARITTWLAENEL